MTESNFGTDGAAILVFAGFQPMIYHNNIEQSYGAGSGSGAIVDMDGTTATITKPYIKDNLISSFGTTTISSHIRLGNTLFAEVDGNRLTTGITPTGSKIDTE